MNLWWGGQETEWDSVVDGWICVCEICVVGRMRDERLGGQGVSEMVDVRIKW